MLKPIVKGEGTTPGERELAKLGDLSFFGLWSYASVHRAIVKGGRTLRPEVADLLVLFGKDVIIFSEKDIKFPDAGDLKVGWGRWFRQSVSESVAQLRGAERHIKSGRSALYVDSKCTQPFPFALNAPDLRVHLVAVCRNSTKPAKAYFSRHAEKGASGGSGTLVFASHMREEGMLQNPFFVGDFDPAKTFVHVFDEEAIHLLLTELDSGPDFIDYLSVRERAIRKERLGLFYGEEDFLAVYLNNLRENGFGDYRTDTPAPSTLEDVVITIEEGMWPAFKTTPGYALQVALRQDAKFWKEFTNDFARGVLTATVGEAQEESLETHERAVRAMASENRASRAKLGHELIDKFRTVPTGKRSARMVPSVSNPERIYIFLMFPWTEAHGTYERYRVERTACMELYARAAQLKFPSYAEIVVVGADTKGSAGSSETVLVVGGWPDMPEEEKTRTLAMMNELRVLTDTNAIQPNPISRVFHQQVS